ncbi:hypothetical protein G6F65_021269 [Rhizopus arrhizus]|nr:hypothetical protein G6F65_021269 [Rhizopus arrhizus]
MQLVLHFVPQRGLAQRPFHALVHLALGQAFEQAHAEGDVVVDAHRERRGLLEHHADLGADQRNIGLGGQQVLAVQHDFAFGALARVELEHAVECAQKRRLTAARRADEGRDLLLLDRHVHIADRMELAVVEVQVLDLDLVLDGGSGVFHFFSLGSGAPGAPAKRSLLAEHVAGNDARSFQSLKGLAAYW